MAELSIVIPVRNGEATLAGQLDALVAAAKPDASYEVVIADNGSTDLTTSLARSYADRLPIRVIEAGDGTGANVARNRGVAAASGDLILFCDADDEVDEQWVMAMWRAFEGGGQLLAGPIDYRRLNAPETQRWRGATKAGVGPMLGFLPGAHSANLAVTRRLFEETSGFDEAFGHGGEDIDLVWRAQLAGYELIEVSDAVVHYRLRSTLLEQWKQAVSYGAGEALLFAKFASAGLRRRPLRAAVGDLWWVLSRAPFAVLPGRRGAWVRRLGQVVGCATGALRHRTLWW